MKICLTPKVHGTGGMVSFAAKFARGLQARGHETTDDLHQGDYAAVLVIGGTRDLRGLWRARKRGIPIVQRLNGMNWIHRQRRTGIRHYLRAEYGNLILSTIRSRLATGIVYQSEFSKTWWEGVHGPTRIPNTVVYNGVDLDIYAPGTTTTSQPTRYRILMVEASLGGGYETGLETGIALAERLGTQFPVELMVVGKVAAELQADWQEKSAVPLIWAGRVARDQIPAIDRTAHLFYAADIHPACPNAVIEALACGLPVAAFDTGALQEIVTDDSGCVVPYGGDPWQLEPPDVDSLADCAKLIFFNQPYYRKCARTRAEVAFSLDSMVEGYLQALQ